MREDDLETLSLEQLFQRFSPVEKLILTGALTSAIYRGVPLDHAMADATQLIHRHQAGEVLRVSDFPKGWGSSGHEIMREQGKA